MTFTPPGTIILVDDDPIVLSATRQSLELADLQVEAFDSAPEALRAVSRDFNGAIITDIRMPEMDGMQLFAQVKAIDPTIPVAFITGHGDVAMAVTALQDGAHDFLTKPFASAHLVASARRAIERRQLELDNRLLRSQIDHEHTASPMIGQTPAILRLLDTISQIAGSDIDVLIEGETGVGKELAAIMLHRRGKRRAQPFVNVDCSVLGADGSANKLIGEFDAAGRRQGPGLIESANRGALFLDEIDKLDFASQALVLGAIEERQIRVGGKNEVIPVDIRVIATSRRDLRSAVDQGQFREDLYYALNVVRLRIPPLRERKSDIPLLFSHFLDEAATQLRRDPPRMTEAVRRRLIEHDWPGNVRELRSFAFQTIVGFEDHADHAPDAERRSLAEQVEQFEAATIRAALEEAEGNATEAMRLLSLPRKTFYDKLNRHRIDIGLFRQPGGTARKRTR